MKKIRLYFLIATSYFLFVRTSCGDEYRVYDELTRIELDNFDYAAQEIIPAKTSLPKEAYIMGVTCYFKYYWESSDKHIAMDNNYKISFANVEDEINIISNSEFDEAYPKGSNVTALFTKSEKQLVNGNYTYFLILTKAPNPGIHSFKVVYKLKNNKGAIVGNTEPIKFL